MVLSTTVATYYVGNRGHISVPTGHPIIIQPINPHIVGPQAISIRAIVSDIPTSIP